MQGTPAVYMGRIVEKKNFRAFIYRGNGEKKLVESWEEFEANMQSGIWFASIEDANNVDLKPKLKSKSRAKQKPISEPVDIDYSEDLLPDDGSVFEVTEDN